MSTKKFWKYIGYAALIATIIGAIWAIFHAGNNYSQNNSNSSGSINTQNQSGGNNTIIYNPPLPAPKINFSFAPLNATTTDGKFRTELVITMALSIIPTGQVKMIVPPPFNDTSSCSQKQSAWTKMNFSNNTYMMFFDCLTNQPISSDTSGFNITLLDN